MYLPAEDSVILADAIRSYSGDRALEIGAGSCIVAEALRQNFSYVVAVDIDVAALNGCRNDHPGLQLVCCDAARPFARKFDLIVSNPPYLPGDSREDSTIYGGPRGVETTLKFVRTAVEALRPGGLMLFVVSSLSDLGYLNQEVMKMGMSIRPIVEKRFFFETLSVIEMR